MTIWDWKYRIYFDSDILKEVQSWVDRLDVQEQEIYKRIVDFYLSFYSFGILFDMMNENDARATELLQYALRTSERIIHTPRVLIPYYKRKIKTSFDDAEIQKQLFNLLELSISAEDISSEYWKLISCVLGSAYDGTVAEFTATNFDNKPIRIPRQKIIRKETKDTFYKMYQMTTNDKALIGQFGKSAIGHFGETIKEGFGYGEWWDREISSTGNDELILFTNDSQVKSEDFLYTIIHEVYPGHGHFYNFVRADNGLMDHGAMMLIEGWATYCEWNTYPSQYVDSIKHNALVFLNNSFFLTGDRRAELIYKRKRNQGKRLAQFVPSIIYATQYVGYLESYYLGALWIEKAIREKYKTPIEFLKMLSKSNKGEFFKLWL